MSDDAKSLAQLAVNLGAAADALNGALLNAERALRDLKLGVAASVSIDSENDARLAFGKQGDQWRLTLRCGDQDSPITSVSREVRVMATLALPILLAALRRVAIDQVQSVGAATERANDFAKTLAEVS